MSCCVERAELTAGSTWHAAGLLPLFNMSYTVGQLHKYSVDLYKRLPAETGQDVSFHVTGNLRLATCRERMDEYQKYCGTANTIGVPFQVITPAQVKELWPLVELGDGADTPQIIGALYHPDDGHIAPADLTMALRKGARARGAEIYEQTEVTAVSRTPLRRMAAARRRKGDIMAEHVVCATGNYARQTGQHVRAQRAGDPGRAPVHRLRRIAGAEGVPPGRRPRARGAARARPVLLPARGAHGLDPRAVRSRRARALRRRRAGLVRQEPVRRRPRAAASRTSKRRSGACRALANCGIKDIVNGPISYTPDGSAADRAGLGRCANRLAQRRPQLRHHRRRRLGLAARGMDRRRRAGHRHARRRSAPLRALHQQALRGEEERGDLPQRLHDSFPGRGAARTRGPPRRARSTTS